MNIVKGLFLSAAANGKLPLNPGGLESATMPKHLRSLVSPAEQQVMHMDDLFSAAEKKRQIIKVHFMAVCYSSEKYLS